MKTKLLISLTAVLLFLMPNVNYGQSINLGTAANFVLFSTNGSVSNTGISQLTGNVGTNNGSSTGFGNVNGIMHDRDGASAACAADLLLAYNSISSTTSTFFPAPSLGNGATLISGVYSISGAASLNLGLTLDAKNDPNAEFIFKINGTFSANANAKIYLKNGAKACNVYWVAEGQISLAPGVFMRGTMIANNAAILINSLDTIEGRALSTAGAITIDGTLAYTPTGCGSPYLTGPIAPDLKSVACFTLFTSNGPVENTGISTIQGSVGTNVGSVTGFNPLLVTGTVYPIPNGTTAQASADLLNAYNYLNTMPDDIELLYPEQFGRSLVLTPHAYIMKAACTFTDSLYLNAQGNPDAVFVIKINGALTTSTFSKVLLINGAQAKNVYWKIEGAVNINNYSVFCGTIVCNNGALGAINTGVVLNGKALLTTGALSTSSITTTMPAVCDIKVTGNIIPNAENKMITFAPNPFNTYTTISINDASSTINYVVSIYNLLGKVVINTPVTSQLTTIKTSDLRSGIYFYKVTSNGKLIQSGKLISQQ
jgi:hypothetical protein